MIKFFLMGGYGFYVWCALGLTVIVLGIQALSIYLRYLLLLKSLRQHYAAKS